MYVGLLTCYHACVYIVYMPLSIYTCIYRHVYIYMYIRMYVYTYTVCMATGTPREACRHGHKPTHSSVWGKHTSCYRIPWQTSSSGRPNIRYAWGWADSQLRCGRGACWHLILTCDHRVPQTDASIRALSWVVTLLQQLGLEQGMISLMEKYGFKQGEYMYARARTPENTYIEACACMCTHTDTCICTHIYIHVYNRAQ